MLRLLSNLRVANKYVKDLLESSVFMYSDQHNIPDPVNHSNPTQHTVKDTRMFIFHFCIKQTFRHAGTLEQPSLRELQILSVFSLPPFH